jgi:uncharacterized membrane protein
MTSKRQYYGSIVVIGTIIGWWMMRNNITETSALVATIVTLLLYAALILYIARKYGTKSTYGLLCLSLLWIGIEYMAIKTCIPYGCFNYTELIGPRFMGTFPWSLLAIRPILVVTLSQLIKTKNWNNRWKETIAMSLLLVFTDLFLDPVAVYQGLRTYSAVMSFDRYGVPFTNYLGWILTGTISVRLFRTLSPKITNDKILGRIGLLIMVIYFTARCTFALT